MLVCLSVSNFNANTTDGIFMFFLQETDLWTRKISLNYGSHPHLDADIRIFLKNFSTLQDRALFHNLAHISGKTDRIFMEILSEMCSWTRTSH